MELNFDQNYLYLFQPILIIIDREAREIMYLVASVSLSVCLSVCPSVPSLTAEPFDLRPLPV